MRRFLFLLFLYQLCFITNLLGNDTVYFKESLKEIDIIKSIYVYEDTDGDKGIKSIRKNAERFNKNMEKSLNFSFTEKSVWLHFTVKNSAQTDMNYILSIINPDIDILEFYEVNNDVVVREIKTGEVRKIDSRDIYHHHFLFELDLDAGEARDYYIKVNSRGQANYIPLRLQQESVFEIRDRNEVIINWLIYGFLLFIFIFNIYLYKSLKDLIHIYYAAYIISFALFFVVSDGYQSYLNLPVLISNLKILTIVFLSYFLLNFTQVFIKSNEFYPSIHKLFNVFKILVFVLGLFYFFNYPYVAISLVGLPLLLVVVYTIIVVISIFALNRNYLPSIHFLAAFIVMIISIVVYELKELNILPSYLIIESSVKIGFTIEAIFLTFAVLERFRISQENAKKTIEESYQRIELQNQELEIINTELEKLSIVASETNNGIAIYNTEGLLEWCNKRFEDYYGVTLTELIRSKKDSITDVIPNKDIRKYVSRCIKSEKPVIFETLVQSSGNKKIWVQTTLSPFIRAGNIVKIISVDSDISDLKKFEYNLQLAKEQAEEADRLKTVFLGNMSHEIRTPLNGIIGFSDLLFTTDLDKERQKKYLLLIKNNGEQLMNIIEDIVDISLIESNQLRVNPKETDLYKVIKETVTFFESFRSTLDKGHIEIKQEVQVPDSCSSIVTDEWRLKQVLNNLLKNAFKFTEKGEVKLGCNVDHENILIYVEDTGIGIDPSVREQIFDQFRQGEESLTRKYGGNGLGLAISKGIVDKLGGKIWLDTEYTQGARFCFTLPVVQPGNEGEHIENKPDNKKVKGKSFLVVEDHDDSYEYLKEILLQVDAKIARASNGKQAVEMAGNNTYDIILMDISLPEQNGISTVREIRKFNSNIPIIAQTAHAMLSQKNDILQKGFSDIITKPINKQLLLQKAGRFL